MQFAFPSVDGLKSLGYARLVVGKRGVCPENCKPVRSALGGHCVDDVLDLLDGLFCPQFRTPLIDAGKDVFCQEQSPGKHTGSSSKLALLLAYASIMLRPSIATESLEWIMCTGMPERTALGLQVRQVQVADAAMLTKLETFKKSEAALFLVPIGNYDSIEEGAKREGFRLCTLSHEILASNARYGERRIVACSYVKEILEFLFAAEDRIRLLSPATTLEAVTSSIEDLRNEQRQLAELVSRALRLQESVQASRSGLTAVPTASSSDFAAVASAMETSPELPSGAEGWAVVPKPSKLAGTYDGAVRRLLTLLASTRRVTGLDGKQLDAAHLRLTAKTSAWLDRLERETPGDFLVFPMQFGLRHGGRSIRRARACFGESEIGLGPFEVLAMLLTHPDRMTGGRVLYIDCAGCDYDPKGTGEFDSCLSVGWKDGGLWLHERSLAAAMAQYGTVSAFSPASPATPQGT